jgi:thiol-disulfide isomerase/thioredoxin
MKSKKIISLLVIGAIGFIAMKWNTFSFGPAPKAFSEKALNNPLRSPEGAGTSLEKILTQYTEQTVIIDIWASWCGDCIRGLSKVAKLQQATSGQAVSYLFLSVDDDENSWKRAIQKHGIQGDHFLIEGGWKSDFSKFLKLNSIPRHLVVGPEGKIELYKATVADNPALIETN